MDIETSQTSCQPQMGPCWPHEPCYQGYLKTKTLFTGLLTMSLACHAESLEFFLSESWLPCRTSLSVGKRVGRLVVTSRCWYVTCQATGSEWWRFSILFLTNSKLTQVITWKQRTLPLGYINSYASQVSSIWGLIAPKCRTYALVNRVSIPSDNGLSPIWRQAVI